MSATCFVCTEYYERDVNPAMSLIPCGHICCSPCITAWRRESNSCPECRAPIQDTVINRGLMDLIEEKGKMKRNDDGNRNRNSTKDESKEELHDKCKFAVYIIDNSGSMEYYSDGKVFSADSCSSSATITKQRGVLRWTEAVSKVLQIAEYNLSRKMCAAYYLLNPRRGGMQWAENTDFIVIDPNQDSKEEAASKLKLLTLRILSDGNIRGDTPLDVITRYFGRNLSSFTLQKPVCFNIITDGEPNDKRAFEQELVYLANHFHIFLTINLCTDNDGIVAYYNGLDTKIGRELSGLDVVDDLEAEQREVINAGNSFFVYSHRMHVCRMAGCFSIVADLMDEGSLSLYHSCKLVDEVCGIQRRSGRDIPTFKDRENYIKFVEKKVQNKMVYDFKRKKVVPCIDIKKLNYLILHDGRSESLLEVIWRKIEQFITEHTLLAIVMATICMLYLK